MNGVMKPHGFTLIEVLIALSIVGATAVTVLYTLNHHLWVSQRSETRTVASMLAREKLLEMEKTPEDSEGGFPEPYSAFSYRCALRASRFPETLELSVSVIEGREEVVLRKLIRGTL